MNIQEDIKKFLLDQVAPLAETQIKAYVIKNDAKIDEAVDKAADVIFDKLVALCPIDIIDSLIRAQQPAAKMAGKVELKKALMNLIGQISDKV